MAKPNRSRQPELFTIYHIGPAENGLALAAALKSVVENCSWGQAKKWLLNRHVQVNGNLCLDEARRVREKDVVKLWHQPLSKPIESSDLRLAFWDEHLLVVEKPAGVTSVRHFEERKISTKRRQLQPTLEELLPPVLAKVQHLRWPPLPPKGMNRGRLESKPPSNTRHIQNSKLIPPEMQVYPVHRLDRDTSGLMLFARTRIAEQKLTAMFRQHTVERQYIGVALGRLHPQTIRSQLVRDRGDGHRGSTNAELAEDGQLAVTHILSVEYIADVSGVAETGVVETSSDVSPSINTTGYSLIRCKLETGRTHQIRIHLSEAGHMLCGDKLYNRTAEGTLINDSSGAPRHALHSDRLAFKHPFSGEKMEFYMAMPRDLSSWLNRLQRTQGSMASTSGSGTPSKSKELNARDEEE